jgi:hypothetical protein
MSSASAAYDALDQAVVLSPSEPNATWIYSGGNWTELNLSYAPSPRGFAGMTSDPFGGGVLLFGGSAGLTYLNDTWTFRSGNWSRIVPTGESPPSGRFGAVDLLATPARILAVGSPNPYQYARSAGETWTFNGTGWTNQTPSLQPVLNFDSPAMTYDAADGYVLFYGSIMVNSWYGYQLFLGETWTYRSGVWTNVTSPTQPSTRWSTAMAYDAADGYVVLFGGTGWLYDPVTCGSKTTTENLCGDTWEFVAGTWTELTPSASPSNRSSVAMTYDSADGYVLLTGGWCQGRSQQFSCNDTWVFSQGNWVNVTATAGGHPDGASTAMAYDAADGQVVLFGRLNWHPLGFRNETWGFLGGHWSNLTAATTGAPDAGWGGLLEYDPTNGYLILFSSAGSYGAGYVISYFDTTWTYVGGSWTNLSVQPTPRVAAGSLVYDGVDNYVLLWGMGPGCVPSCPPGPNGLNPYFAWGSVVSRPTVSSFASSPAVTDVGVTVALSVAVSGGSPPLSFDYSSLPPGCGTANRSTLSCTPTTPGVFLVRVVVTDGSGFRTSADLSLTVHPDPAVSSFSSSPDPVSLGHRTVLSATVTGGTTPWSYAYSGLPSGCPSQDVPLLPCLPGAAGTATVLLQVTDGAGVTALANLSLVVSPVRSGALTLSGLEVTPSSLVLGNSTYINVTAVSAAPPITYAFTGLPSGCSSANASVLLCTPDTAGSTTVTVYVADSAGDVASTNRSLTVFPIGGGGGLTINSFSVSPPVSVQGTTLLVSVGAAGGVGGLSYSYGGLPTGCGSANVAVLSCTPTAPGEYRLVVLVSDSGGDRVGTSASITVWPSGTPGVAPLRVVSFLAAPDTVPTGESLRLTVTVSGGEAPLAYAYSGLPRGCSSVNQSQLTCVPSSAGTYDVLIVVGDSAGQTASAEVQVTITPSTGGDLGATPVAGGSETPLTLWYAALAVASGLGIALGGAVTRFVLRPRAPPRPPAA